MSKPRTEVVLILEDDPGVAILQKRHLERGGYQVICVTNPEAAIAALEAERIDLLLLDKLLSDNRDGLDFYMVLKGRGLDLPVILVTGYSDDATMIRAFRAGVRDYVKKSPEYLDYLPEAVERVLEKERTQLALVESKTRLDSIIESALDAVITLNEVNRITLFNRAAEEIFHCTPDEAMNQPIERFLPGDLPPMRTHETVPLRYQELVGQRANGERFPLEASISRVELPDASVITLILRDITERKKAEMQLIESNRQLEMKSEELRSTTQQLWQAAKLASVGELAASIAHELNNPLGTVSLRLESVLGMTEANDPRRRMLEIIDSEIERMISLIANLLQFSRHGREQVSTVNVCEEILRTLELTQPHFKRRGVIVKPEMPPDVPMIYADRQKLRQVFLNLFTNAGDAMPEGGTLIPRVQPTQFDDGRQGVLIEVKDTGVGIPEEHLPRVMEPFFTTKEEGKGTGLGLAICKRIIQDHHGQIEIKSIRGQGTTVRILLPIKNGANVRGL